MVYTARVYLLLQTIFFSTKKKSDLCLRFQILAVFFFIQAGCTIQTVGNVNSARYVNFAFNFFPQPSLM